MTRSSAGNESVRPGGGRGAAYAGDVPPAEAWALLAGDPASVLIDVRSLPEWQFVGVPDLSGLGKRPVLVGWHLYPAMNENPGFYDELRRKGVEPHMPALFLCRSGGRSRAAAMAMAAMGYARCYNVAGGFEGPPDTGRHRGTVGGWKVAGLPWIQE